MKRIRRPRSLLHAALLVLVAIGMLLQPLLGAMGELHASEHAVAVQSDHGHSHDDSHDDSTGEEDFGDPIGAHDLLHQGGVSTTMALLEPSFCFLKVVPVGNRACGDHGAGPPIAFLTQPFRPPIA